MLISAQRSASAAEQIAALVQANGLLQTENESLKRQLDWLKRQIFGQKSERRIVGTESLQLGLGELSGEGNPPPAPVTHEIAAHTRRQPAKAAAGDEESKLFFDEQRVPVEVIALPNPEATGLAADAFEVISEKVSYRLAQRPGSYVILKYVRPVIKLKATLVLSCPPAPQGVIEGSRADVSFLAGMLVDKFAYHLPLYRQHQRLTDSGITVSRQWLTQLTHSALDLLAPIHDAQLGSIRASRVKAMDETPIKAGRAGPGKMKGAYFWPVYGERDEVSFLYFPSRSHQHVEEALGLSAPDGGVLLSDGYAAYSSYAKKVGLTQAQCWAHSRRNFFEAHKYEPQRAAVALDLIGKFYAVEAKIREEGLSGPAKHAYRTEHTRPLVEKFFDWVEEQFKQQGLLPSNPLLEALSYVRERRAALEVFVDDPDVPIDTNHLERALRAIPLGRKNWLFCWTEVGAQYVGIANSLIVTCRLHGIDPYDYFVDVLQRVAQHPASQVEQLTPRLWKQHFAVAPLRSDVYRKSGP